MEHRRGQRRVAQKVGEVVALSQATVLESQLIRSMKKPLDQQGKAVTKYMTLYAHVPRVQVITQIWDRAQQILHGSK